MIRECKFMRRDCDCIEQSVDNCAWIRRHIKDEPPPLISEREKTHGPFSETAWFYCELTKALEEFRAKKEDGTYEIHAALDLICMKIARIAAGNATHEDHWQDIIGYSELALASIRRAKA